MGNVQFRGWLPALLAGLVIIMAMAVRKTIAWARDEPDRQ